MNQRKSEQAVMTLTTPDYCTRQGAQELAVKSEIFWHKQGHINVQFWVDTEEICRDGMGKKIHIVRSNLFNGLPPKEKGQ